MLFKLHRLNRELFPFCHLRIYSNSTVHLLKLLIHINHETNLYISTAIFKGNNDPGSSLICISTNSYQIIELSGFI